MKTLTIYENGNQITVVIPDEDKPLHELAKDGKIFVLKNTTFTT